MLLPRVTSGVPGLDEKIRGGIPEGSSLLVYGPPKCGKTVFAVHFFHAGLKGSEPGIYILTEMTPIKLKQTMLSFDLDVSGYENQGLVNYIDMFSSRAGELLSDDGIVKNVLPGALTNLMITVSKSFSELCPKSPRIRTVLDSISTLLETSQDAAMRFLQTFIAKCNLASSTTILVYTEGTADKQFEAKLMEMVDGIIYLDGEGNLYIKSLPGTPSVSARYKITDNGITVF